MIELILPYPPSVNHYKNIGRLKTTKTGKMYQERINSPETMYYYVTVMNICRRQGVKSFDSAILDVTLHLFMPDNRKRDIDNPCKVLLDSLVKAQVILDDSQIHKLTIERKSNFERGKVHVFIKEFLNEA
jgi:crossover junction endodeoxyribonuclease RusA